MYQVTGVLGDALTRLRASPDRPVREDERAFLVYLDFVVEGLKAVPQAPSRLPQRSDD